MRSISLALLLALAAPACSDDAQPVPADAAVAVDAAVDRGQSDGPASPMDFWPGDLFHSDASTCTELSFTECFANVDCTAALRCQNVGSEALPLACCVLGARGAKAAGEPCANENECASAVCIAKGSTGHRCSMDCTKDSDCPVGMQQCIPIAFSGSPLSWCFPES